MNVMLGIKNSLDENESVKRFDSLAQASEISGEIKSETK